MAPFSNKPARVAAKGSFLRLLLQKMSANKCTPGIDQVWYTLAWFVHVSGAIGACASLGTWGIFTPWIIVSLVSVVLIGPIGAFVLDPRMRTIIVMAREAPDGLLPDALERRTHDLVLGTSADTLVAILLGVVFLMTTKPSLVIAILVMGVALFLGLLVSLPIWHAARRRTQHTAAPGSHDEVAPFLRKTRLHEAMVE